MRDPTVNQIDPAELRPTQMTLGFREVEAKRREWRAAKASKRIDIIGRHGVPTVLGPKGRFYVVDHHHLARALMEEGEKAVQVYILADLAHLEKAAFWTLLDNSGWCHAYDHKGRRCELSDIPKSLADMADDPYRSLAGPAPPLRRLRQDRQAVRRVHLGRLPAPAHRDRPGGDRFRRRPDKGHGARPRPGRPLPARLVRRGAGVRTLPMLPVGELSETPPPPLRGSLSPEGGIAPHRQA